MEGDSREGAGGVAADGGEDDQAPEASEADVAKANEAADRLDRAMKAKDRGAELYKQGLHAEARETWREALADIPAEHDVSLGRLKVSLLLNLSQVALVLKDYQDVIQQCTAAIKIDHDLSKAFFRRGLAQDALGKVKEAAGDMQKAARIEPRNADIRKKYEELKKKALELEKKADEEAGPPVHDLATLPRAFIDVAIGEQPPARLVFALYTDTAPKTAENFRQLCTGEHAGVTARGKPFHFKGCILHRMIPGLMIQGGDFENSNGTGGESIYGRRFADETFVDKHTRRGLLAMANDGPNNNGSNFFVSFAAAEHLDRRHVIFGELVSGWELLDELEKLPTDPECRPLTDCVVVDCGELPASPPAAA